jgi:AcrR family transcriptional regulator
VTPDPAERSLVRPERGTRPVNRRQLIIGAATDLFSRKGYAGVSMGDVAEAVAIGPSALYRHFRGKQELLATVVTEALETLDNAINAAEPEHPTDVVNALAVSVLEHRGVGVLWQREARQLSPADRIAIQAAVNRIGRRFASIVRARRPELDTAQSELLAWSGLAVATSISYHAIELPEPEFAILLSELVGTAIDAPVPTVTAKSVAKPLTLRTDSRRETLLFEATKLFAAKGFNGVSTEDIGASIGITGPSVYNHFPAKSDILVAAMFRGDEWLRIDMHRAFAQASDAADGLSRLLGSYSAFVLENPHLVRVLVCEANHLPDPERGRTRAAQYAYIAEWVNLLREVHPEWDAVHARIRVQAALTVMNDVALTPSLRNCAGVESALVSIGAELLATTDGMRVR